MKQLVFIAIIFLLSGCAILSPTRSPQYVTVNVVNNSNQEQKRFYYVRLYNFNSSALVQDYQSEMLAGRFFDLPPGKSKVVFNDNFTSNFLTYNWEPGYDYNKYPPQLMVFVGGCNSEATAPTRVPYAKNGGHRTVTYTYYNNSHGQVACRITQS